MLHVLVTYPGALATTMIGAVNPQSVSLTLCFLVEVVPNTMPLEGVVYPGALINT
jgi:hypothetical protein